MSVINKKPEYISNSYKNENTKELFIVKKMLSGLLSFWLVMSSSAGVGIEDIPLIALNGLTKARVQASEPIGTPPPDEGVMTNLSMFVRFSDEEEFVSGMADHPTVRGVDFAAYYDGADNTSSNEYYDAISRGKFRMDNYFLYPNGSAIPISYQDSHPRNYHRAYDEQTNPIGYTSEAERNERFKRMQIDALNTVDLSDIDIDRDRGGSVDNVVFFYGGNMEVGNMSLWGHRWSITDGQNGVTFNYNGCKRIDYNYIPLFGDGSMNVDVLRTTIMHEFMHTLNLPDLDAAGVGQWSIMNNHNGKDPNFPTGYEREKLDWITSVQITESGTYTLDPVDSVDGTILYRVKFSATDADEYYFEYRKSSDNLVVRSRTDNAPETGLLVYRVNRGYSGKGSNLELHNDDEIYVFRPGEASVNSAGGILRNAALNPGDTLGSADGNETVNTIYDSAGVNTGIVVSNVQYQGTQLKFDIQLPAETPVIPAKYDISEINVSIIGVPQIGNTIRVSNLYYNSTGLYYGTNYASEFRLDSVSGPILSKNYTLELLPKYAEHRVYLVIYGAGNRYTGNTAWRQVYVDIPNSPFVISQADTVFGVALDAPIVEAGYGNGAITYEYQHNSAGEWVAEQPTAVGIHKIRGIVAATESYARCMSAEVAFTISKANSTLEIAQSGTTYGTTLPDAVVTSNTSGAAVTYEYTGYGLDLWAAEAPNTVGHYEVRGNTEATENYNAATSAAVEFYINALVRPLEVTGENADNADYVNRNGNTVEILRDGTYTISLQDGVNYVSDDSVKVAQGVTANITLNGVKIDVSGTGNACAFDMTGATVNLTLVGENSLKSGRYKAGLQASGGSTLTIDGMGSLEAVGSNDGFGNGAGIGGGNGTSGGEITINGGTIIATGGSGGSGIGGGNGGNEGNGGGGEITINGGAIATTGGYGAAGIGCGLNGNGGTITITGGKVTATGGYYSAGIGDGSKDYDEGYGYGDGDYLGEITITGGTITATSGSYGAAIGGGYIYLATGTVTIDGGSVKVNNFSGPQPKNSELKNVYLNTLTLDDPSAVNARVTSLTTAAVAGSASAIMAGEYGTNGVYADESGIIYAWLPDSGSDDEEVIVKAGGKTYKNTYIRAADNNNASTLAKIAGADDVKVILTPDATSKNAGYDGHIDVSFDDATGYDAYALAIPMIFDNDTIEITSLETVDFDAKGLEGLLVNGTFLKSAMDYDSSSEVLSVINSEGKFLLSWTVEENVPLTPHTLTEDVYFRIHYRVKENVPTSASFAIGEYNDTNGITGDQIFGIDGLGVLCSNQDDFGAYLLVDGEYGILTQEYVSITVEDMPAVEISGDVNSISLQGRAMLTGKQRTPISAIGYTPDLDKMDAGIRVEMYEVDGVGVIVKQVGSVAYTQEMNMTAAIGDAASTLYNYTLKIPQTVANDLVSSDPNQSSPKYMLRFSRFGDNGGSVVGTVREESYLWADIYLDGTSVNIGAINESMPLTVGGTAYLYAGAFYLPTADKFALTTSDLNTIKGQVGNTDIAGVTTIFNINEYLGVDAADYTTVLRYVGKEKLQPIPLVVSN
ncbi:MAG: hypothetical protein LBL34_02380 [Clostridiales bacterium]|jgi:M6 family metalloprotease-like protein|nr:hypothetical protein [Clostridiales bacterium]